MFVDRSRSPLWIPANHVQKTDKFPKYFDGPIKSPVVLGYTLGYSVVKNKFSPQKAQKARNDFLCLLCFFVALFQLEAADSVFADAAEVEDVVVFDDVGDLGEAVGWTVLEVFDDFALGV